MAEEDQHRTNMKRNLLLCVDAFGTLFRPRSPIAEQYGSVARGMGVEISDDEVAKSFKSGKLGLVAEGTLSVRGGRLIYAIQRLKKHQRHIRIMERRPTWGRGSGGLRYVPCSIPPLLSYAPHCSFLLVD